MLCPWQWLPVKPGLYSIGLIEIPDFLLLLQMTFSEQSRVVLGLKQYKGIFLLNLLQVSLIFWARNANLCTDVDSDADLQMQNRSNVYSKPEKKLKYILIKWRCVSNAPLIGKALVLLELCFPKSVIKTATSNVSCGEVHWLTVTLITSLTLWRIHSPICVYRVCHQTQQHSQTPSSSSGRELAVWALRTHERMKGYDHFREGQEADSSRN